MMRIAYLEQTTRPRREEQIVAEELARRGLPVKRYTLKQIHRRSLPLGDDTFVMGAMDSMHGAMKQLGIPVPRSEDYPEPLRGYLHRKIWRSTLAKLCRELDDGRSPVFAKPADRRKSFTGRVFASPADLWVLGGVSRAQEIWCSEVVAWVSEFRVYIVRNSVVAVDHYAGDKSASIPRESVDRLVATFCASGEASAGFALDLGILSTGQVALVEVNDGYSLGAYAVAGGPYYDLLEARWAELVSARTTPGGGAT